MKILDKTSNSCGTASGIMKCGHLQKAWHWHETPQIKFYKLNACSVSAPETAVSVLNLSKSTPQWTFFIEVREKRSLQWTNYITSFLLELISSAYFRDWLSFLMLFYVWLLEPDILQWTIEKNPDGQILKIMVKFCIGQFFFRLLLKAS